MSIRNEIVNSVKVCVAISTLIAGFAATTSAEENHVPSIVAAIAPVPPERITSVFGDWTVTCARLPDLHEGLGERRCEAGTTVQDPSRQLAAVLAIGRPQPDQALQAIVQVQADIRTATPVTLTLDADNPVIIPFLFCNRLGCFARLDLSNDSFIHRMRTRVADAPGRIEWHGSSDADIALPFSTRGFAAAMDDLIAEAGK